MKELINHFLKQPLDSAYIERIAFQYFDSDYRSAEIFLSSLKEEKNYMTTSEILNKKISLDLLKQVILYRVQEIIDLTFEKSNIVKHDNNFKNSAVFLIGGTTITIPSWRGMFLALNSPVKKIKGY